MPKAFLHRDLKPSNIMLDGSGNIRIADFGLATLAGDVPVDEIRDGTPAYQAPEQASGRDVTVRSDIYALGLVLHELFTGTRYDSRSAVDSRVTARNPAIAEVIDACLDEDPAGRPESALAVAAALPGGDPLRSALEAGRTPSADAVANAPVVGALRPWVARVLLAVAVVAILIAGGRGWRQTVLAATPDLQPPDVLVHRAKEILAVAGHDYEFLSQALDYETRRGGPGTRPARR